AAPRVTNWNSVHGLILTNIALRDAIAAVHPCPRARRVWRRQERLDDDAGRHYDGNAGGPGRLHEGDDAHARANALERAPQARPGKDLQARLRDELRHVHSHARPEARAERDRLARLACQARLLR